MAPSAVLDLLSAILILMATARRPLDRGAALAAAGGSPVDVQLPAAPASLPE